MFDEVASLTGAAAHVERSRQGALAGSAAFEHMHTLTDTSTALVKLVE
jgi:hypothetical protein